MTVVPKQAAAQLTARQWTDLLSYFDPDAVYVPRGHERRLGRRGFDGAVVTPSRATRPELVTTCDGVALLFLPTRAAVDELSTDAVPADCAPAGVYLLSDLLSVSIDLIALEANLEGQAAYAERLPSAFEEATHLLTTANPDYRKTLDGLHLQGAMPGANDQGGGPASVAHLELRPEGLVNTTTRTVTDFGLEALAQVGRSRAETLRDAGLGTPNAVVDADHVEIQKLEGFGRSLTETVKQSARAFVDGAVRYTGDGTLPDRDPVYIDIETDGLTPTMIWLIGALDGRTGEYESFLATDPDHRGEAVEAFLRWLGESAAGRPVVAYNGRNFDFPAIEGQIQTHCPQFRDRWADVWTVDPLFWARTKSNAVLPGRTNELKDVAAALGYDRADTGLSGQLVGELFSEYMTDPGSTTMDWDRHERYCEQDVRALAHVYEAVREAAADASTGAADDRSTVDAEDTAQGTLTDF